MPLVGVSHVHCKMLAIMHQTTHQRKIVETEFVFHACNPKAGSKTTNNKTGQETTKQDTRKS